MQGKNEKEKQMQYSEINHKHKPSLKPEERENCKERLNENKEAVKSGMCSKCDAQYLLIRLSACCE